MIAMTTRSSIKVNARRFRGVFMVLTQFSECKVTRRSASILASLDTIVPSKYYTQRHVALQSWKRKIRSWRRHSRSRTISASIVLAAAGRRRSWRGGRVCRRGDQRDRDIESAESLMP